MARRTKADAQATRSALLDAAEQLFQTHGVSRTSLNHIAVAAGTTRGAIYWHFKDKADLFNAMMDRVTLPLEQTLNVTQVEGSSDPVADIRHAMLEALRKRTLEMGCDELIRACHASEPIGDVLRFQFPFSQRRHYERLARFPDNYLVMGDALTSFNPIYGQGMTVAACEALALRDALQEIEPLALRQRFFAAAAKLIDTPWQLAVGADLALPFVEGPRSLPQRLIGAYIARLHRAAVHDVNVSLAFQKVVHLLAPPSSLFAPGIVARVLVGGSSVRHRLSEGSGVAARTCTPANAAYRAHPPSAGEQP